MTVARANLYEHSRRIDGDVTMSGLLPANGTAKLRNMSPAISRAYDWAKDYGDEIVLEYPPSAPHGYDGFAHDEYQTLNVAGDGLWGLTIRGSGAASKIVPVRASNLGEKLYLAGGGPQTMSFLADYENMFWVGDPTIVNGQQVTDCWALFKTSADISVRFRNCRAYGIKAKSPEGMFPLNCMNLDLSRVFLHACGHEDPTKALVSCLSGIFGAKWRHFYDYPSEHRDVSGNMTNPFGGPAFEKSSGAPAFTVWLRGDAPANAPSHIFEQCTIALGNGFILADPDGGSIQSIELRGCKVRDAAKRTIKAVHDVGHISISNGRIAHNNGSAPTIEMVASSCKRLTLRETDFAASYHKIDAKTGQTKVRVLGCSGGSYDVTGALNVERDASTTYDSWVGP